MRLIRTTFALIGLVAIGGIAAACGTTAMTAHQHAFAWLRSASAAGGSGSSGAALVRPPGWQALKGDPGSTSFVLRVRGTIVGYLNATPRSGAETLANWSRFRPAHNREEGDRDVRTLAAATGITVDGSSASCVIDQYRTSLSRYREIACLVRRSGNSSVVLGAAPPSQWSRQRPVLEHAIATYIAQ